MKLKWTYTIASALIVIALIIALWRGSDTLRSDPKAAPRDDAKSEAPQPAEQGGEAAAAPALASPPHVEAEHNEDVRKGLEAIVEGLKQMGAEEVPPIADELDAAVAGGDPGVMVRAFNQAIYGRFSKMSDAIPALKVHLEAAAPYARYLAADALARVGDDSAVPALTTFVSSKAPILHGGVDLRIQAARTLGQYGDERAVSALVALYEGTKNSSVLNALTRIQRESASDKVLSHIIDQGTPGFVAFNLGLAGLPRGEELVQEAFDNPQTPSVYIQETKTIAAWALARTQADEQPLSYLIELARPAVETQSSGGREFNESVRALLYLGSIQSAAVVRLLEEGLDSPNATAVRYATVNLLFNQSGGSEKAKQVVIRELHGQRQMLGLDLTMQIASQLDDPQVRAAAEDHDRRTGGDRWRYWGVERAEWPVQTWIYDYVVALN